jgi:dUTP pyrophosphatase
VSEPSFRIVAERLPEFSQVPLPRRATPQAACFDLYAAAGAILENGQVTRVRTGLKLRAPPHTFLEVRPRSGLSTKGVIMTNAPGTIDADYADEVQVPMTYLFPGRYEIHAGDRIGQIRLVRDEAAQFEVGEVALVEGRAGGFGSTGR